MRTEQGIVITTTGTHAVVGTCRPEACAGCRAKDICNGAEEKNTEITVENQIRARPGDTVILGMETLPFLKVAALLYLLPVMALIAGSLAGAALAPRWGMTTDGAAALAGLLSLAATAWILRRMDGHLSQKSSYHPRILRILPPVAPSGFQDRPLPEATVADEKHSVLKPDT